MACLSPSASEGDADRFQPEEDSILGSDGLECEDGLPEHLEPARQRDPPRDAAAAPHRSWAASDPEVLPAPAPCEAPP